MNIYLLLNEFEFISHTVDSTFPKSYNTCGGSEILAVSLNNIPKDYALPEGFRVISIRLIGDERQEDIREVFQKVSRRPAEVRERIGLTDEKLKELEESSNPYIEPDNMVYLVRYAGISSLPHAAYPWEPKDAKSRDGNIFIPFELCESLQAVVEQVKDTLIQKDSACFSDLEKKVLWSTIRLKV